MIERGNRGGDLQQLKFPPKAFTSRYLLNKLQSLSKNPRMKVAPSHRIYILKYHWNVRWGCPMVFVSASPPQSHDDCHWWRYRMRVCVLEEERFEIFSRIEAYFLTIICIFFPFPILVCLSHLLFSCCSISSPLLCSSFLSSPCLTAFWLARR